MIEVLISLVSGVSFGFGVCVALAVIGSLLFLVAKGLLR